MRVETLAFSPTGRATWPSVASSSSQPDPREVVSLSGQPDKKKIGNAMAWTGFGIQCVGAAITLKASLAGSSSWVGVGIFAAGAALLVAGEMMKRR